jgi:hypothetical protein
MSTSLTTVLAEVELGKVHRLGRGGVDMVVGKKEKQVAGIATSPPYIGVQDNDFQYQQVIAMVLSNLGQWPGLHVIVLKRLGGGKECGRWVVSPRTVGVGVSPVRQARGTREASIGSRGTHPNEVNTLTPTCAGTGGVVRRFRCVCGGFPIHSPSPLLLILTQDNKYISGIKSNDKGLGRSDPT